MKNLILYLFILFVLISCSQQHSADRDPLHIVVTTSFIKDGVKEIVGDSAEVTALIGPSIDPSTYQATTEDIDLMKNADVLICNGLNLESKMNDLLEKYAKEKPVFKVCDGVDSKELIQTNGITDPNICLDLEMWMQGMNYIAVELGKIDTLSAPYFLANYKILNDSATSLDRWIAEEIDSLVQSQIVMTTSNKYMYFFRRYQLTAYSMNDSFATLLSDQIHPQNGTDFIIENKIPFIFTDASSDNNSVDSIIVLCEQKSHVLQIGGQLYADTSGELDTKAGTYFGMLLSNLSALEVMTNIDWINQH